MSIVHLSPINWLVMVIYFFFVLSFGVYYQLVKMPEIALCNLNPSLWWKALLINAWFGIWFIKLSKCKKPQRKI